MLAVIIFGGIEPNLIPRHKILLQDISEPYGYFKPQLLVY